jgi:hypothetical protein
MSDDFVAELHPSYQQAQSGLAHVKTAVNVQHVPRDVTRHW